MTRIIPPPFTVRPVRPADADDISVILRELGWFTLLNAETPEATAERIETRILQFFSDGEDRTALVAENIEGVVVGFICVHWLISLTANEGYISHLFVSPAARGQGVGKALLASVTELARVRECKRLMLYIRSFREAYQRGFYRKSGWEEQTDVAFFTLSLI